MSHTSPHHQDGSGRGGNGKKYVTATGHLLALADVFFCPPSHLMCSHTCMFSTTPLNVDALTLDLDIEYAAEKRSRRLVAWQCVQASLVMNRDGGMRNLKTRDCGNLMLPCHTLSHPQVT